MARLFRLLPLGLVLVAGIALNLGCGQTRKRESA